MLKQATAQGSLTGTCARKLPSLELCLRPETCSFGTLMLAMAPYSGALTCWCCRLPRPAAAAATAEGLHPQLLDLRGGGLPPLPGMRSSSSETTSSAVPLLRLLKALALQLLERWGDLRPVPASWEADTQRTPLGCASCCRCGTALGQLWNWVCIGPLGDCDMLRGAMCTDSRDGEERPAPRPSPGKSAPPADGAALYAWWEELWDVWNTVAREQPWEPLGDPGCCCRPGCMPGQYSPDVLSSCGPSTLQLAISSSSRLFLSGSCRVGAGVECSGLSGAG